jgi:hypothetical protein
MTTKHDSETAKSKKFRDYAAECRRMARDCSGEDRETLLEIAEAWIICAEEVERKANRDRLC